MLQRRHRLLPLDSDATLDCITFLRIVVLPSACPSLSMSTATGSSEEKVEDYSPIKRQRREPHEGSLSELENDTESAAKQKSRKLEGMPSAHASSTASSSEPPPSHHRDRLDDQERDTLSIPAHCFANEATADLVRHWWGNPSSERKVAYQSWLRHHVAPVRAPVQMVPFPATGLSLYSDSNVDVLQADAAGVVPCMATQQHLLLVGEYEKRVCPSLFSSPLHPTSVVEEDEVPKEGRGTASVHSGAPNPSVHRWVSPPPSFPRSSARLLNALSKRALECCIPIQEALLFFSLTLIYLDALSAIERWGRADSVVSSPSSPQNDSPLVGAMNLSTEPAEHSFLHLSRAVHQFKCRMMRLCHDKASFQIPLDTHQLQSEKSTFYSAYNLNHLHTKRPATAPAAAMSFILWAAEEWERRRSSTVTVLKPTGVSGIGWAARDVGLTAKKPISASAEEKAQEGKESSGQRRPLHRVRLSQASEEAGDLFAPFAPRETPRHAHYFKLPPLPPDPMELFFAPVWGRVILYCLKSRGALACFREYLLKELTVQWNAIERSDITIEQRNLASGLDEAALQDGTLRRLKLDHTSFKIIAPVGVQWRYTLSPPNGKDRGGASVYRGFLGAEGPWMRYGLSPHTASFEEIDACAVSHLVDAVLVDPKERQGSAAPPTRPLDTAEELADFVSRVGACLRRDADPSHLLTIPREHHAWIDAIVRHRVSPRLTAQLGLVQAGPIAAAGPKSSVLQWRLRASARNVGLYALLMTGREVYVGVPAQLASSSPVLHPMKACTNEVSTQLVERWRESEALQTTALAALWEDGSRLAAAREYIRLLFRVRYAEQVSGRDEKSAPALHAPPTELTLKRTEEAALHRLFQSHPCALELMGCGIKQFTLRVSDVALLLHRHCGTVLEWSLEACYHETGLTQRLRSPRRCVMYRAEAALPLPPDLPPPPPGTFLSLPLLHSLLDHYHRSLSSGAEPTQKGGEEKKEESISTTLFPSDEALVRYIIRHHPAYWSRWHGCGIQTVLICNERAHAAQGSEGGRRGEPTEAHHSFFSPSGKKGDQKERKKEATGGEDESQPLLLIQYVCGRTVPFRSWGACFASTPPYGLNGYPVLMSEEEIA